MIELTQQPIDFTLLTESVRSHQAGAVVLFLGTVREFTGEARTAWLEYEAFPEMATAAMQRLEAEVRAQFSVIEVAMSHRYGQLALGDIAVAVVVSSPHRAQAFEAGRWLIDTLKHSVPIWKKEHYADGRMEWLPAEPVKSSGAVSHSETIDSEQPE
ncbi:MAG: molybdenum cofactor biosynthesis protein MoaE [Planctomycetota bacterium]|nr:molybdenum cofactor biosynthesis protein MoaE [Planctomycetales bacterium]RLT06290.1 MAG: molybdenum cofactor biosynthesis protein MoaE [Planctomycetota bacterium]